MGLAVQKDIKIINIIYNGLNFSFYCQGFLFHCIIFINRATSWKSCVFQIRALRMNVETFVGVFQTSENSIHIFGNVGIRNFLLSHKLLSNRNGCSCHVDRSHIILMCLGLLIQWFSPQQLSIYDKRCTICYWLANENLIFIFCIIKYLWVALTGTVVQCSY